MTAQAEFEATLLPLNPILLKQATRLKPTRDDARDLVQDTLERAIRKFGSFQPGTSLVPGYCGSCEIWPSTSIVARAKPTSPQRSWTS